MPVDFTGDDDLIDTYIAAAIAQVERDSERVLGNTTAVYYGPLQWFSDCTGQWQALEVTCLPLLPEDPNDLDPLHDGIVSVEFRKTDGTYATIDSAYWQLYRPGQEPALLLIEPGHDSEVDVNSPTPYRITINVGYEELPANALQAIKLWVAECYRTREVMIYGQASTIFKQAYDAAVRSLQWRVKG